jgi:DNA polymerase-3 subunit delta
LPYILWGQDDFSINETLAEIKKGIGDPTVLLTNATTLDGQQMTMDELRAVCETVPFLAEKRLVIVEGLLELFEIPKRNEREKKKTKLVSRQNEFKSLSDYIDKIPDSTILVLIGKEIKGTNPMLKELKDKAKVRHFPLLRNDELRAWVEKRVQQEGGTISARAVGLLGKMVGGNLWIMASEIDKLIAFAYGRRIEEEDVKMIVSHAQQANIFAMVDAILESKVRTGEHLLQQLLQKGAAPGYIMTMISRQVRLMIRAKELKNQGKSRVAIQNQLGIAQEFALRKTLEQADRYSLERIKEVYHKLLEADLSIKTGRYEDELTLNLLVAELCR